MGKPLSDEENNILLNLRASNVLSDISPERIRSNNGAVLVCCGDGDLFADKYERTQKTCKSVRIHPVVINGGGLNLARMSPLTSKLPVDEVLIQQIVKACTLKKMNTVIVYGHWPCGVAKEANLKIYGSLRMLLEGIARLRLHFAEEKMSCQIVPKFHVLWGNNKRRSYFLSRKNWEEFSASIQRF